MSVALKPSVIALVSLITLQVLSGSLVSVVQAGGTATPIKHIVVVMMENHSFDNVFGVYPSMNRSQPGSIMVSLQAPDDALGAPRSIILSQVPNGTYWTVNPGEGVYKADWDDGKMDGFAANSGSQAMTYFGPSQLAVEWNWAEEFAVADRYFSSCLCTTNPNRLYSLAGYGAGISDDSGPPPYIPVNNSIFAELDHYAVSWGYYIHDPAADIFPLTYFDGIEALSSRIQNFDSFYAALRQGTLPSVAWVMPTGGGALGIDQHPRANVTVGQDWLLGVVNRVMQSSYWNSTAIFITYDEGGGYYDHVSPPILDGVQLGFRVPFFVISPYAKENYVSATVMNHASTLAFVDYNWHLPALNSFVADSGLPLDMFDFNRSYLGGTFVRPPIVLTNTSAFPQSLQIPLTGLPYQRTGSTSGTLSTLGVGRYNTSNWITIQSYQSLAFATALAVLTLAAGYYAARRNRKSPL